MMIPILPQLENRDQWVDFFQRQPAYAQVKVPSCRVDLQSTYLQITDLSNDTPVRYTLGSRTSIEPIWQLISRCNWSLEQITEGLRALDFGTNARDKALTDWSPDLSVRRSLPRERQLYSETGLGGWPKPDQSMPVDSIEAICRLIAWDKVDQWQSELSPPAWLSQWQTEPNNWQLTRLPSNELRIDHPELPAAQFRVQV